MHRIAWQKSSDFHEILYTAAYFELDERHVIKNEKVALDRLRVRQNIFLVIFGIQFSIDYSKKCLNWLRTKLYLYH